MKPTEFYQKKTEDFIKQLNKMKLTEFNYNFFTNDIHQDSTSENNSKYNQDKKELEEIKFDIKLMLTEFDNGSLFLERINNFSTSNLFSNEPLKNNLWEISSKFVEFLKEYRN
ncbi:hypothetical protein PL372_11115 [Tenacibaculum dicentrarchi]|nr:hypothetical protein [Tenacibaculum dicentrarchi]MDB0616082.1 hypothetical protein [Tenacibaculum dicentrarchi]